MAFKVGYSIHQSQLCPGVSFKVQPKTYGRRLELDTLLAKYREDLMGIANQRDSILNQAREQAVKSLGLNTRAASPVLSLDATGGTVQASVPEIPAEQLQQEISKFINYKDILNLNVSEERMVMEKLRPIYFKVYLADVTGLEVDEVPLRFSPKLAEPDQHRFYVEAPGELIDEIFDVIADHISMTDQEKAFFGLSTTFGGRVATETPNTIAATASNEGSTDSATADCQTS